MGGSDSNEGGDGRRTRRWEAEFEEAELEQQQCACALTTAFHRSSSAQISSNHTSQFQRSRGEGGGGSRKTHPNNRVFQSNCKKNGHKNQRQAQTTTTQKGNGLTTAFQRSSSAQISSMSRAVAVASTSALPAPHRNHFSEIGLAQRRDFAKRTMHQFNSKSSERQRTNARSRTARAGTRSRNR